MRELVGVERRAAHEPQDAAVARIDRHRGAAIHARHGLLERALHPEVERQHDVVPRDRRLARALAQPGDAAPIGVHDHELGAVAPAQDVLVAALDAGASDQVAQVVAVARAHVELLLVDLGRVAEQVRGQAAVRVVPQRLHLDLDPRQLGAQLLDRRQHRERHVVAQHRGLPAAVRERHPGPHLGGVEPHQRGDPRGPVRAPHQHGAERALHREGAEHHVEAGRAVGEQLPAAVVDRAARRAQHLEPHAVLLRELEVAAVLDHLEPQQSDQDQGEAGERRTRERGEALLPKAPNLTRALHDRTGVDRCRGVPRAAPGSRPGR